MGCSGIPLWPWRKSCYKCRERWSRGRSEENDVRQLDFCYDDEEVKRIENDGGVEVVTPSVRGDGW
jgi:hypothetical protein